MKIKICGLFQSKDIEYVNEVRPDYIGFVFAKSKREVDIEQAQLLKSQLDQQIKAVGVFVNSSFDKIVELVDRNIIEVVQLHGNEDALYIKQLKELIDAPIIKAIKVTQAGDLDNLNYDVDYYLLDNKISGSGKCFDWALIKTLDKPFFLAGGIDLANLDEALKINCYGIDVSSGAEKKGSKDRNKIVEIVRKVKNDDR